MMLRWAAAGSIAVILLGCQEAIFEPMTEFPIWVEPDQRQCRTSDVDQFCVTTVNASHAYDLIWNQEVFGSQDDWTIDSGVACVDAPFLNPTQDHHIQVVARNSFQRMPSVILPITFDLDKPDLLEPTTLHVEHIRRLRWSRVPIASAYEVEVARSPGFNLVPRTPIGRLSYRTEVVNNWIDLPNDFQLGTYFWRVRVISPRCEPHEWSDIGQFEFLRYGNPIIAARCPYCRGVVAHEDRVFAASNVGGAGALEQGIRVFVEDGNLLDQIDTWANQESTSDDRLEDVVVTPRDRLMVSDSVEGLVYEFNLDSGAFLGACGEGRVGARFQNYRGLAVSDGSIYAVQATRNTLRRISAQCGVQESVGIPGSFDDDTPTGRTLTWGLAAQGSVLAAITRRSGAGPNEVVLQDLAGGAASVIPIDDPQNPGRLIDPTSLTFDEFGNLIVTDSATESLLIFRADGLFLRRVQASELIFSTPWDIDATGADTEAKLYVTNADQRGSLVRLTLTSAGI